jgi:hypothetical protein
MSRVLTECLKGLSYFRIAVMSLGWISDRFSGYVTRSCMGYVWTHWLVGYWMTLSVADVTLRRVVAWLMGNKPESISNQALLAWFKDNIPRVFLKEFRKPTNNLSTQQSRCLGRFETDTSKNKGENCHYLSQLAPQEIDDQMAIGEESERKFSWPVRKNLESYLEFSWIEWGKTEFDQKFQWVYGFNWIFLIRSYR